MDDTKQRAIETKIDGFTGDMGRDMIALLALNSRLSVADWRPNRFITEFSESLGFKLHIDTAVRIIKYLYPANRAYWKTWDQRYTDQVKSSAWLKYNKNIEK